MLKQRSQMRIGVRPSEASRAQLMELVSGLQRAREAERAELARQVHDDLTQNLTVISMELFLAQMTLKETGSAMNAHELTKIQKLAAGSIDTARAIVAELRPKVVDEFGFMAALEWLAETFERRTGIACRVCSEDTQGISEEEIASDVLEAIEEILRELQGDRAETAVQITTAARSGTFSVEVQHNGTIRAMEHGDWHKGLSVLEMKTRPFRLKGGLHTRRDPDNRMVIRIETPLVKAGQ